MESTSPTAPQGPQLPSNAQLASHPPQLSSPPAAGLPCALLASHSQLPAAIGQHGCQRHPPQPPAHLLQDGSVLHRLSAEGGAQGAVLLQLQRGLQGWRGRAGMRPVLSGASGQTLLQRRERRARVLVASTVSSCHPAGRSTHPLLLTLPPSKDSRQAPERTCCRRAAAAPTAPSTSSATRRSTVTDPCV